MRKTSRHCIRCPLSARCFSGWRDAALFGELCFICQKRVRIIEQRSPEDAPQVVVSYEAWGRVHANCILHFDRGSAMADNWKCSSCAKQFKGPRSEHGKKELRDILRRERNANRR
jgi:hypothetical protein